ncbi:MAG: hypothetical protein ABIO80_05680 [Sphingomicrobium sp.]
MTKQWIPRKATVELAPSRIRRAPVRIDSPVARKVRRASPEREVRGVVAGVILFTAAWGALAFGVGVIANNHASNAGSADDATASAAFGQCYNHGGPDCVMDGDTVYIGGDKVEIAGLDAPEIQAAQCGAERDRGIESALALAALLNRGAVVAGPGERSADGQVRRHVTAGGTDVGAAMVSAGNAREPADGENSWC